ncbi:MAG: hypothetical protein JST48_10230 [Bacteroidetes bacterium]|nr:hypothetical protein [Bacteroidota bacterium]
MKFFLTISLFIVIYDGAAQVLDKNYFGINYRFGSSNSVSNTTYRLQNPNYKTIGLGLSYLIKLKPPSHSTYSASIPYIRTELNYGARSGQFDVNNTATRLSTSCFDMTVLIPATFKVTESIFPYLSLGGNLSYRKISSSYPPINIAIPQFKPGMAIEIGVSFVGERLISICGVRLLNEFGDYSFQETSFFWSLCGKRKKKE